ncbi:MAG: hypothetical protein NTU62_19805, partial [Spirochaetes bacterium]|nr:hypothetical protein [Spirochaetota bacterium]
MGLAALAAPSTAWAQATCARIITADVVVFDQPLMFNRLGSQNVNGIMYALRRDVVNKTTLQSCATGTACQAGLVTLRPDKRPRPLVIRAAAGDCLDVAFQNLLNPAANTANAPPNLLVDDQVLDRRASFHAQGLELRTSMLDDGSFVGSAAVSGLVTPGISTIYKYYAPKEGTYLVTSHGATFGSDGAAGNNTNGMFAVVNVEPAGANFYRSQVTEEEMRLALDTLNPASCPASAAGVTPIVAATPGYTCGGQPILDYEATYPSLAADGVTPTVWALEGKGGLPVLNMLSGLSLVHSDLNAVITGNAGNGSFPITTYPLESKGFNNPTLPNRLEPFREYTVVFHDEAAVANAFPLWFA